MKTRLETWFERDRASVILYNDKTDESILEFWDEEVEEAKEDGFLTFGKGQEALHQSCREYANSLGLMEKKKKIKTPKNTSNRKVN